MPSPYPFTTPADRQPGKKRESTKSIIPRTRNDIPRGSPGQAQCSPIKPGTGSVSTPERYPGYADVSPENDRRDNPSVVVRGIPPPQKDPVN